jgi:hypothetical protein
VTRAKYVQQVGALLERLDVRHFGPLELCRVGAKRHGKELLAPPATLHQNLAPTIVRLEAARRELDGRIQVATAAFPGRGHRSEAYNRAIGGAERSLHREFNALDCVPVDDTAEALYEILLAMPGAREHFGLALYRERGFVHFDTRGFVRPGTSAWIVVQ